MSDGNKYDLLISIIYFRFCAALAVRRSPFAVRRVRSGRHSHHLRSCSIFMSSAFSPNRVDFPMHSNDIAKNTRNSPQELMCPNKVFNGGTIKVNEINIYRFGSAARARAVTFMHSFIAYASTIERLMRKRGAAAAPQNTGAEAHGNQLHRRLGITHMLITGKLLKRNHQVVNK